MESVEDVYARTVNKNKSEELQAVSNLSAPQMVLIMVLIFGAFYVMYSDIITGIEQYFFAGLSLAVIYMTLKSTNAITKEILNEEEAKKLLLKLLYNKRSIKKYHPELCDIPDGDIKICAECNMKEETISGSPLWWEIAFQVTTPKRGIRFFIVEMFPYGEGIKALYSVDKKPKKEDLSNIKMMIPPEQILYEKMRQKEETKLQLESQKELMEEMENEK